MKIQLAFEGKPWPVLQANRHTSVVVKAGGWAAT